MTDNDNSQAAPKTSSHTLAARLVAMFQAGRDPSSLDTGTVLREQEPLRAIELAERAYKEVLDATKHQDDKVGRFLTAIAFLTTGSIALIATGVALRRSFS